MNPLNRAVASLSLPGGQDKHISSRFPYFPLNSLIFPQIFLIIFLILLPLGKALAMPLPLKLYNS